MYTRSELHEMGEKLGRALALEKLALDVTTKAEDMKSRLRAGDVILTSGAKPKGAFNTAFMKLYTPAARLVTKDYAHVTVYLGGGKVLQSMPGAPAQVDTLDNVTRQTDVKVIRPTASVAQRRASVGQAMKMVGGKYDSGVGRFYKILFDQKDGVDAPEVTNIKDGLYCVNTITRAYPKLKFAPGKSSEYLRPLDLDRSSMTKDVILWRNPKRWNPHLRLKNAEMSTSIPAPRVASPSTLASGPSTKT